MAPLIKIACLACGLLWLPLLHGQNVTLDPTAIELRPLDDLLAEAQAHSPLLQLQSLNADLLRSDLLLLKKEWSNYVALSGSFQIGNVQFIDNLSTGGGADVRTVTRENIFAVAGLTVRLPLSDFLTKGERRQQLEIKLEQQRLNQQQKIFELRQVVIRQYNDLQRALRVLDIRNRDLNFHVLASETAERYFREGNLTINEYTDTYSKRNEAEVRLAEAQLDAQLLYLLLLEVVGTNIKTATKLNTQFRLSNNQLSGTLQAC